ncbi:MAG: restriction endonuclease subunit S [Solobacterium sp.]|nr:restriction endonuclease subunit S [Solobacterium sp.]MDY5401017.1 restriction endonuclease subunit S [Erysipelotrichaceae bacterium]
MNACLSTSIDIISLVNNYSFYPSCANKDFKIKIDKEYFCYAIRNSLSAMSQQTHGATMKHITKKDFDNILIPYPDLNVQRQIANNLETVNELIESYEKELILLEQLVKARFIEMFGDPEENPFNWEKILLAKVIINANNGMARRGNDKDGNIVMRLVELQDGYIDYSNPNRIILKDNEKKRYLLKDEDFLFARVNGNPDNVGRCAVFHDIGEDVYHNDHIIRVHFDEELLNGTFASALFNSDYGKKQLKSKIKTSAGQYTVSQDGIGAIATILPPAKLQNQFADFVQQVDKSKFIQMNSTI